MCLNSIKKHNLSTKLNIAMSFIKKKEYCYVWQCYCFVVIVNAHVSHTSTQQPPLSPLYILPLMRMGKVSEKTRRLLNGINDLPEDIHIHFIFSLWWEWEKFLRRQERLLNGINDLPEDIHNMWKYRYPLNGKFSLP